MVLEGVDHYHQTNTVSTSPLGYVALISLISIHNLQVPPCLAAKGGITIQTKQKGKGIVHTGTVMSCHHSAL